MVSTGLIIDSEETALMWRGLMLSKALEQSSIRFSGEISTIW